MQRCFFTTVAELLEVEERRQSGDGRADSSFSTSIKLCSLWSTNANLLQLISSSQAYAPTISY